MHFDGHESRGGSEGWQQILPHLLVLELVLNHQRSGDHKTLIIYSLLLKSDVICRTDLTVTPEVSLFHSHFFGCAFTTCIDYSLFCNSVLRIS